MEVTYILNLGIEAQENAAAVNRSRAFIDGIVSNGLSSKIFFPYSKLYKSSYQAKFMAFITILKYLIKAKQNEYIIFYGDSIFIFLAFFFKRKLKFVVERNEYPYYLINNNYPKGKIKHKLYNKLLKLVDGFITCSYSLQEYYKPFLSKKTPILISPLIINIKKFTKEIKLKNQNPPYLGYCGSLGNNKDGLPILIKSFSKIVGKYPLLELRIAGNGNEKSLNELRNLVNDLNLNNRVLFVGNIPHSEMPSFLANAKLLVLARPNNKQAEGGFPSKLGEYMSVKVPIIVTNVGELHNYLIDGYNCFMAEPDSIMDFSNKIVEALEYKHNDVIALNAYRTVKKFDSIEQSKVLIEFLKKL